MSKRNKSRGGGNKGYMGIEKSKTHIHHSNDDKVRRDKSEKGVHVKSPGHLQVQPSKHKPSSVSTALSKHQSSRNQKSSINSIHPSQSHQKSRDNIERPVNFSRSHQSSRNEVKKPEHFSQSHEKKPSNYRSHSNKNDHHRHEDENSETSSESESSEPESESSELEKAVKRRGTRRKTSNVMKLGYVLAFVTVIAPTVLLALIAFEVVHFPRSTRSSVSCSFSSCTPHSLVDGLIIVAISEKSIKYSCLVGRLEQGESTYKCGDNGEWSNQLPPKCIRTGKVTRRVYTGWQSSTTLHSAVKRCIDIGGSLWSKGDWRTSSQIREQFNSLNVTNGRPYWVGVEKTGEPGRASPHDNRYRRISDQSTIFSFYNPTFDNREGMVAIRYNDGSGQLQQRTASDSFPFICEFPN